MKRLCYIGIILSYIILAYAAIFLIWIQPDSNGLLHRILIGVGVALLLASIGLVGLKTKQEDTVIVSNHGKLDTWLKGICLFPVIVIGAIPLLLFVLVFLIIDLMKNNFRKLTKPLIRIGFVMTKQRQGKATVFLFSKGDCVIRMIPYKTYQISFDKGVSFCHVTDADIGTKEERRAIVNTIAAFDECDYRDKDTYEPTRVIVDFLVNYLC